MKLGIFIIVLASSLFACQQRGEAPSLSQVKEVDVCVYGGASSGVVAAYSAKQMGKTVLLIEPGKYLGGMTTGGLGMTDIGNKYAVTGLARLFYRRVGEHYGKFEQWTFPPSVATKSMNRFVEDADLDVMYYRRITKAEVRNKEIKSIILEDSQNPLGEPLVAIKAKEFIDCSYEGDLMARAGVSYVVGREDNSDYDETLDGVQLLYAHQFPDGIDPYVVEGDSTSGLCWGIQKQTLKKDGTGDRLVQAYNFRLCLTDNKDNQLPFVRPESYDSTKYELLARAVRKMGSNMNHYLIFNWGLMPENKYDVNNCGPLSTDMIGMNYEYPDGDYDTRAKIWKEHVEYTKGLLYFLSHDDRLPEALRKRVSDFGWAKDEFVDNDNFPTQLYVREARRMVGEYVMTQKNCQGEETVGDAIGMAAYGMDSHNCQRIVTNGMVKNEGDVQYHGFPPYPISYRSITPKHDECTNLLVPVCVSSTHIAFGSIRMEPVFMVLGQSAAVAACMAIEQRCPVQQVDINQLRKTLRDNPYLDGSIPEILVDDSNIDKVYSKGRWTKKEGGHYKSSYKWSDNEQGSSSFTFMPVVKQSHDYTVYFYCTALADENLPEQLSFDIKSMDGLKQAKIQPRMHKGEWVSLGTYHFEKGFRNSEVTVQGKSSKGAIFADAILLVPKE